MNAQFTIYCGSCSDCLTWVQESIGNETRVDPAGHVQERGWRWADFYYNTFPHWKCSPCFESYLQMKQSA